MIVYQIVRDVEDLGVRGQDVRQLGQVELGTADLHPERVVDVDDVAAAVGRTSVCNFLKKEKIVFTVLFSKSYILVLLITILVSISSTFYLRIFCMNVVFLRTCN
jgi:hypothetical protein